MLFGLTFHLALVQSKSLNFFSESYKKAPPTIFSQLILT